MPEGLYQRTARLDAVGDYGAVGDGVHNDTASVQATIDAAAELGAISGGVVTAKLPAGYRFRIGPLVHKNNVRLSCYGATIVPDFAGGLGPLITTENPFDLLEIAGGYWLGAGTESSALNQWLFFNPAGGSYGTDLTLRDMRVANWGLGPIYVHNAATLRILDNILTGIGNVGGGNYNALDIVANSNAHYMQDVLVRGNIILDSPAAAIAWVNSVATTPYPVKLLIAHNICTGLATSGVVGAGSIQIEVDEAAGGPWSQFIIADNFVDNPGTNASAHGISIGTQNITEEAIIRGNVVHSAVYGIEVGPQSGDTTITDNRITAPTPIRKEGGVTPFCSGNRFSTGPSAGRAALVAGTVTVDTAEVQAGDNIILTRVAAGGALGELSIANIVAGTSFDILSASGTETSTVYWRIDH